MKRFFLRIFLLLPLAIPATLRAQTAAPAKPQHNATPAVAAPEPLPDVPTLLHKVEIARQQNATIKENYFFDATTTRDSDGHTKSEVTEISYIHGVRIEHLIARNGKPLPPEDAAKEKERNDKAVAKAKARVAKEESKGVETDSNGDVLITLDRLLQIYSVSNERREMVSGRSAIAFDFTGNHSVKTKGVSEAVLQSFSGTIWIDEKDSEIAKMTGSIANGYRLGLGLLINISKGTGGTVEFAPINNEVWLPSRLDGQGHARFLLVDDALDGAESTVFSNFHKFETGVKVFATVAPADAQTAAPPTAKP